MEAQTTWHLINNEIQNNDNHSPTPNSNNRRWHL